MYRRRSSRRRSARGNIAASVPLTMAVALTVSALTSLPRTTFADGLPAQAPPEGFRSTNSENGGRILDGTITGVESSREAIRAGLHKLSNYFGGTLVIAGAVRSKDGQSTTAIFRATLHGTPVTGLSMIAYAPHDGSREAAIFDTSTHFPKSMSSLVDRMQALPLAKAQHHGGGQAEAHESLPPLVPQRAADGTVGISIPSDWRVVGLGDGRVTVLGPHKEIVALNRMFTFIDSNSQRARNAQQTAQFTHTRVVTPVPIAPFSNDVGQDYINAFAALAQQQGGTDPRIHITYAHPVKPGVAVLSGTRYEDGQERTFLGTVMAGPSGMGSWSLTLWQMSCATSDFKTAGPLMMAIEKTCTYNAAVDARQKQATTDQVVAAIKGAMKTSKEEHDQYMAGSQSRFESSMAAMRASQDSIDRSAAGWIHVIKGTSVLERTDTGEHITFDSNVSSLVAQIDPGHYQVVPLSEFRKGVDY